MAALLKYEVLSGPVVVPELDGREFQTGQTFKGSPALAASADLRVVEDAPRTAGKDKD